MVHRASVKHQAAGTLSRMVTVGLDETPLEDDIPCFAIEPSANCGCLVATVQEIDTVYENVLLDWEDPLGSCSDSKPDEDQIMAIEPEQKDAMSIAVDEFLSEHAKNPWCISVAEYVGKPASRFGYDHHGFLSPAFSPLHPQEQSSILATLPASCRTPRWRTHVRDHQAGFLLVFHG